MTRLLFNKEDEGTGGGGGTNSLLNTGSNPPSNATPPPEGDKGGKGGGNEPSGNSNASGGTGTPAWISSLPKELQEDASLKKFSDIQGLAQSYINAQKLIGSDKIPVPGKHSTDEDWKNIFSKLGLPESVDKYEVKFGETATLDKKFVDEFRNLAHKSGILPKQAQALADWFTESNKNAEQSILQARQTQVNKEIEGLKTEWGAAFQDKINYANNVLKNFADQETLDYLGKTGMANDVRLVKLLASAGEKLYKEGKIVNNGDSNNNRLTPIEAKKQAQAILGNKEHPYNIRNHPGHKAAVDEVAELFKMATVKSS